MNLENRLLKWGAVIALTNVALDCLGDAANANALPVVVAFLAGAGCLLASAFLVSQWRIIQ